MTKEITEKKVQEICETLTKPINVKISEIEKSTEEATEANKNCKQLMDALTTFIKDYASNTATELTDELRTEKLVKKTESLAIISKRLEEVKGKLEAGDLKTDDAAKIGTEYKKLKIGYEKLIEQL